jgi:hypothetical protein
MYVYINVSISTIFRKEKYSQDVEQRLQVI